MSATLMGSYGSYGSYRYFSYCEEIQQSKNSDAKCELYNSIFNRLSFAERRDRCLSVSGCRFDGSNIAGTCLSDSSEPTENFKDILSMIDQHQETKQVLASMASSAPPIDMQKSPSISNSDSQSESTSESASKVHIGKSDSKTESEELKGRKVYDEDGDEEHYQNETEEFAPEINLDDIPGYFERLESSASKRIHVMINEQIAAQASGQLKNSKEILYDTVKSSILDSLHEKSNAKEFGDILGTILRYDQVQLSTRDLIYWSLATKDVIENMNWLCKQNIQYWIVGEGKEYSRRNMASLISWWLTHPETPSTVLKPQLDWYFAQPDTLQILTSTLADTLKSPKTQVRYIYI